MFNPPQPHPGLARATGSLKYLSSTTEDLYRPLDLLVSTLNTVTINTILETSHNSRTDHRIELALLRKVSEVHTMFLECW